MKKVAFFVNSLERGGAERVTVRLAEYFYRNGIQCYVITNRTGNNEYPVPDGVERFSLSTKKSVLNSLKLRRLLKQLSPNAVAVMGTSESIIAVPGSLGLKTKLVISERNDPKNYLGNKLVIGVSRWLMRFADDFVFQTSSAKSFYDKKLKGRGRIIFNPIVASDLPDPWTGERVKKFVTAGRLEPQKNQKLLIEAFSEISSQNPDFQLNIYGSGSLKEELESEISKRNMNEKIFLCGNQPNVLSLIRDAYAFILPSDFEGMPNALIEAMAVGLPCISTDCPCGGPAALIKNKENGILIPVNDKDAMVNAMQYVIDNTEIAKKYGEQAYKIRDMLDISNIGKEWEAVLLE